MASRSEGTTYNLLRCCRQGSSLVALHMVRAEYPLPAERVLELGHHILKAHLYKGCAVEDVSPADLQSYWTCLSTNNLSAALSTSRNLFSPNIKVGWPLATSCASVC